MSTELPAALLDFVTLDLRGDEINVIGMASLGGPYIESFRKTNGKKISFVLILPLGSAALSQ